MTYTYRTVRLKIYSPKGLAIGDAFSILERECDIGSFDLANEPTFKLSEVVGMQMVMIIIII